MNAFFHVLIAAAFTLMLAVPAARGSTGLEEVLELPAGVNVVAAEGFRASEPDDAEWLGSLGWAGGAVALVSWETALLTLEAEGPRTLRLFHTIGGANTGGYTWVRLDGRKVREYNYQQGDATDVVVPAGKHHIDLITYATPVLLHRVVELRPGLPVLEQPELTLPDSAEVHLHLRAVSDSPVTWAAENLPAGLVLDADGLLHGTAPERSLFGGAVRVWVTMTNAVGSQLELVNLFPMQSMEAVAHGLPLAARSARSGGHVAVRSYFGNAEVSEPAIKQEQSFSAREGVEIVTTVTGPDTLWFRAQGSTWLPGPMVVRLDGAQVMREFTGAAAVREWSVAVPAGEHEIAWSLPQGGMLGGLRLESSAGPRVRGPFVLKARPLVPFSHTLEAAHGPVVWSAERLPVGVSIDRTTGVLTGVLLPGSYYFAVLADRGAEVDRAVFRLEVQEDAATALGTPGWDWLLWGQGARGDSVPRGPAGEMVWRFSSGTGSYYAEGVRMETSLDGPLDITLCHSVESGFLEVLVDDETHRPPPGWDRPFAVHVPEGRHLLVLRGFGGLSALVLPLEILPAGSPRITLPVQLVVDDTAAEIPLIFGGGPLDSVSATVLPPGVTLGTDGFSGSMSAVTFPESYSSQMTAARAGLTSRFFALWRYTPVNGVIGGRGWHAFSSHSQQVVYPAAESWDGIQSLALTVPRSGGHTSGVSRSITGPDHLTFHYRSRERVRMEVKLDDTVMESAMLAPAEWQKTGVAIPAGEHRVTVCALSELSYSEQYEVNPDPCCLPALYVDHFRLASEALPEITEARRHVWVAAGRSLQFTPASDGKIREWSVSGLPAGSSFDAATGTISVVAAAMGEYPLTFTAENLRGSDAVSITLHVTEPPAAGDSARIGFNYIDWELLDDEDAVRGVDGEDVHYGSTKSYGNEMTGWVQGPDTLSFWYQFTGNAWSELEVRMDGEQKFFVQYNQDTPTRWARCEIEIPAGTHKVQWLGSLALLMDHITLASDGLPRVQETRGFVQPGPFSLPFTAVPAADTWEASHFSMSPAGVLSGTVDGQKEVFVSATNAAGTGYAAFYLIPGDSLNEALDSPLEWSANPALWVAKSPGPGVEPAPVDGVDYVESSATYYEPLTLQVPPGGGLFSFWIWGSDRVEVSNFYHPDQSVILVPELASGEWTRVLYPLRAEGGTVSIYSTNYPNPSPLWVDRAEILRPGDPLIDVCPLPALQHGVEYHARLQMLSGEAVSWSVQGLPTGLKLDAATGEISGTVLTYVSAETRVPLRIVATTTGGGEAFAYQPLPLAATSDVGLVVTTVADGGPGSLRAMLAEAAALPGSQRIGFAHSLSGQRVVLDAPLTVNDPGGVIMDATMVSGGMTLTDSESGSSLLLVENSTHLALQQVHLADAGSTAADSRGGAATVMENATLELNGCVLSGNHAARGGAIACQGTLITRQSRFSGNSADEGGAISMDGGHLQLFDTTLAENSADSFGGAVLNNGGYVYLSGCTLSGNSAGTGGGAFANAHNGTWNERDADFLRCTFAGNSTAGRGGAIYSDKYFQLIHCTVSSNSAALGGGGICLPGSPFYPYAYLRYSILAGNHAPAAAEADILKFNGAIYLTASLVGIGTHALLVPGPLTGSVESPLDAQLAPLGDYGGPTHTMPLALNSPARNAGAGSTNGNDQRGMPMFGDPDLGAYENDAFDSYAAWSAERLPHDATTAQRAGDFDFDGDGETNYDEWINGTYPASGASRFVPAVTREAGMLRFSFPTGPGRLYRLHTSRDLHEWNPAPGVPPVIGDGDNMNLSIPEGSAQRLFYKITPELR